MSKLDELDKVEPCEYHYDCWYCSKFNDYVVSKARLEEREAVARTIGLSASTAGLSPKDLAKDDDWKEAVEKIKRSEREAMKKEFAAEYEKAVLAKLARIPVMYLRGGTPVVDLDDVKGAFFNETRDEKLR